MNSNNLEFSDWIENIKRYGTFEWTSVLRLNHSFSDVQQGAIFSILCNAEQAEKELSFHHWANLDLTNGRPTFEEFQDGEHRTTRYERHPHGGMEYLVFHRCSPEHERPYFDVSEEFRLFYDLHRTENEYYFFSWLGDKIKVIEVLDDEVKIRSNFLKKYLSVRKKKMLIHFEFMRFPEKPIAELGYSPIHETFEEKDFIYKIHIRNMRFPGNDKRKSQGVILGKKLVRVPEKFILKEFEDRKNDYVEFIIGIDEHGQEQTFSCNEDLLGNYFGLNPDAPQFVTPVYFKREVLAKYYASPAEYKVGDGDVSRKGFWSLRIDNNHSEYVIVFLGDLGRIHYEEQLYWKSFNIYAEAPISRTSWERHFLGQFGNPQQLDLYFKEAFNDFGHLWYKKYQWHLFKPLNEGDTHHFETLRIPLKEEQREFDNQILSLVKIFIDSINEKKLKSLISVEIPQNAKGIDKLELFLKSYGLEFPSMIKFFRDLQDLRSTGTAHRKSTRYTKVKERFGMTETNYISVFNQILKDSIMTLNTLKSYLLEKNTP